MKQRSLLALLLIGLACTLHAQSGWVSLFNGKDLSGWKQLNGKARYEVKDGTIVGTTVDKEPNSFLATEKEYGDFILELEFRLEGDMNSGIQFRSQSRPEIMNGRVHGYQMEIDPSARSWSGGIYEEAGRAWLYTVDMNPASQKAYRHKQWNTYRIECRGNDIRTWVNGIPVAHLVDDRFAKGFIALQVHSIYKPEDVGQTIAWRNIRIQTVNCQWSAPTPEVFVVNLLPNHLSEDEKKQGYTLLFDGRSVDQWRGAYKTAFPEKGWAITEGELRVEKSGGGESVNGGDIVTKDMYAAFILQFEFRITEGANSGVKYFVTEKEQNSGSAIGLEYQILDDNKHPDAKQGSIGNRTMASLYDLIPSIKFSQSGKKVGDWNRGMIVVYPDNRVEHWLNGYKVVEYQRGVPYFQALVARSKYQVWENFGMAKEGRILLQDHGDAVAFRSIKIRRL